LRVAVGPASALASGLLHSCAVVGGGVWCWGDARTGQVGTISPTPLGVTPVPLPPLGRNVATVGTGLFHSCAVALDGSVRCWGSDGFGELGDGTVCMPASDGSGLPLCGDTALAGVTSFLASAVAVGERFSCALRRDAPEGTVWCWGYNAQFRLGDGTMTRRLAPVRVTVLP
jgi:alpha-tubulin suppressor-like RCC1 family protein